METRNAAASFWRVFGAALVVHIVATGVPFSLGSATVGSLVFAAVMGAWASRAPRGASIGLASFSGISAASTLAAAVWQQTWWWIGCAALDVVALLIAVRAIDAARAYLADMRERATATREWDRVHRAD